MPSLDADEQSVVEDAEPAADSPRRRAGGLARERRTWWIAAFIVAVVVLTGGVVSFTGAGTDTPESVVTAYLAAVREADTDKALAIAQVSVSSEGGGDGFLEPAVISHEWDVESVRLRAQSTDSAIVDVTTSGPDGTKDGVFLLYRPSSGEWGISNALVNVMVGQVPVWSQAVEPGAEPEQELVINGKSVTFPAPDPDDSAGGQHQLLLFPGSYRFYPKDGDRFAPIAEPATWLPSGDDEFESRRLLLRLSDDTEQAAAAAVAEVLDDCVAATKAQPKDCPFGADDSVKTSDGYRYADASEVSGELPAPPDLYFADTGLGYFQPVDRGQATVVLHLSDEDSEATVECGINFDVLRMGVTREAEVSVLPNDTVTAPVSMDTCSG